MSHIGHEASPFCFAFSCNDRPKLMKKYHLLCAAIRESQLLEKQAIETFVSDFETANPSLEESTAAEKFAEFLIRKKAITLWQARLLVRGKYRGFFLGNYKILSLIGKGGMSTVYLVEHVTLRKKRALKILPNELNENSSQYERFIREARASASLEHPNIVRAFDIDKKGDTHFIVLEFVDGKDLDYIAKTQGPLGFNRICDFMVQACEGLQFAHESGMIHRDIKPANLILDKKGVVKVLDMGLALQASDEDESEKAALTITYDDHLGTADYLAPEQAINSHGVDARADIYSLGGTFYFLLTGQPPFPDGSVVQRVAMHQTQMPRPIKELRPDCPDGLVDICWRMLQKKPAARYASAKEVKEAILNWLANGSGKVPVSVGQGWSDELVRLDELTPGSSNDMQGKDLFADGSGLENPMPISGTSILDLGLNPSDLNAPSLSPSHMTPDESNRKLNDETVIRKNVERTKLIWMSVGVLLTVGATIGIMAVLNSMSGDVLPVNNDKNTVPAVRE